MKAKSYKKFEKSVSDCNCECNHYYVRYQSKRLMHYMLYCTVHGYRTGIDRETAIDNVKNGAVCVYKGNPHPTDANFKKIQRRALTTANNLKRKEAQKVLDNS